MLERNSSRRKALHLHGVRWGRAAHRHLGARFQGKVLMARDGRQATAASFCDWRAAARVFVAIRRFAFFRLGARGPTTPPSEPSEPPALPPHAEVEPENEEPTAEVDRGV